MKKTRLDRWASPAQGRCAVCRRLLFKSELKKKKGFYFCEHCWPPKKSFFAKAEQREKWEQSQQHLKVLRKLNKLKEAIKKNG
jgi:hypothetical protein